MSNELKYSYFFDKKQNKEIRFEEFLNYVNQNNQKLGIYEGNIYCPYCKVAKLSFVRESSQKVAYLRTTPGEKHEENCIYNYDLIDEPTFTTYFESLNIYEAQDKLNAIMNELFKDKNIATDSKISSAENKLNLEIVPVKLGQTRREIKYLRRKKLVSIKHDDILPDLYAFYSKKVKLEIEHIRKGQPNYYYYLCIKCRTHSKEWKTRFKVYIGQNSQQRIPLEEIDTNKFYSIVMIGNFVKNKFDKSVINLIPQTALLFKVLE